MSFQELLATSAGKIRVTDESPPRYSITDIIGLVYRNMGAPQISETFRRARRDHVLEDAGKIRFSTHGRPSQVVTAEEAERILQLLPGKWAAAFRIGEKLQPKKARADCLYIMKYSNDDTCVKIGRSDNVEGRWRHLEAGQNFKV